MDLVGCWWVARYVAGGAKCLYVDDLSLLLPNPKVANLSPFFCLISSFDFLVYQYVLLHPLSVGLAVWCKRCDHGRYRAFLTGYLSLLSPPPPKCLSQSTFVWFCIFFWWFKNVPTYLSKFGLGVSGWKGHSVSEISFKQLSKSCDLLFFQTLRYMVGVIKLLIVIMVTGKLSITVNQMWCLQWLLYSFWLK